MKYHEFNKLTGTKKMTSTSLIDHA